jgi:enoyl-CoA hydratase/carnithine racemase
MTSSSAVTSMAPSTILEENLDEAGVLRLTLNRPNERNALSSALLDALLQAIDRAGSNDSVRAVVIAGNGPGFCAGHDLREITAHRGDADGGRHFYERLFASCTRLMSAIRRSPLVFIAEVGGTATAAGCQLVASCDMAVASSAARFGVNGIDSGLFCSTPMVAVARNLPHKLAMELLTTGRLMSAEEAKSAGLVNRVVEPEALRQESDALAARLVKRSRAVLALGKRAFYAQIEMRFDEAYEFTEQVIVDNLMMADAEEGIAAFLARRAPVWKDR